MTGLAGNLAGPHTWQFAFLANGGVPPTANTDLTQFLTVLVAAQPTPLPGTLVPDPDP